MLTHDQRQTMLQDVVEFLNPERQSPLNFNERARVLDSTPTMMQRLLQERDPSDFHLFLLYKSLPHGRAIEEQAATH